MLRLMTRRCSESLWPSPSRHFAVTQSIAASSPVPGLVLCLLPFNHLLPRKTVLLSSRTAAAASSRLELSSRHRYYTWNITMGQVSAPLRRRLLQQDHSRTEPVLYSLLLLLVGSTGLFASSPPLGPQSNLKVDTWQ